MKCPDCDKEIRSHMEYCPHCSADVFLGLRRDQQQAKKAVR